MSHWGGASSRGLGCELLRSTEELKLRQPPLDGPLGRCMGGQTLARTRFESRAFGVLWLQKACIYPASKSPDGVVSTSHMSSHGGCPR